MMPSSHGPVLTEGSAGPQLSRVIVESLCSVVSKAVPAQSAHASLQPLVLSLILGTFLVKSSRQWPICLTVSRTQGGTAWWAKATA